jgi:SAM-dependent methyltransferase
MGFVGGALGFWVLRNLCPQGETGLMNGSVYQNVGKLETLLGRDVWQTIKNRTVIDFGCGLGAEAVELAQRGARRVIGLDIQEHLLAEGRAAAARAGVAEKCLFAATCEETADVIISLDAFEHFGDPEDILRRMHARLAPAGRILVSFGPTWYHPLGGHLFSVFPWAHLVFTEKALIRWRSDFKTDGATRFSEVAGGLNQMTIRRFESTVRESPLQIERLECVPIRKVAPIANRVTREWTTAIVRAVLRSRDVSAR